MPETEKNLHQNKLQELYNDLSNAKKEALRNDFSTEFDYKSEHHFYKKLNGTNPFWNFEKKWLAARFNTTENELFPEIAGEVGLG